MADDERQSSKFVKLTRCKQSKQVKRILAVPATSIHPKRVCDSVRVVAVRQQRFASKPSPFDSIKAGKRYSYRKEPSMPC